MSDPTRPIGSELAGRYRIEGFLKRGGMGAVYRATHLMLNRQVALKLIKPELVESEETVRRFEREARAASQLDHPNIVTIHDLGRADDGTLFIAMELVEGRSLRELVVAEGALDPGRAARLGRGIARALARAHSRGIVHRDLKPQNIMVATDTGEEVPKLLDFGIAKSFESEEPALTATGMVIGTPQYMSPEQAQGLPVDARADLYAFGVILYEMLAGHVPFQDTSVPALLVKHLSEAPPPLLLRRPGLPPGLVKIVERCLEKQPDKRYASADELVTLLAGPFDSPGVSATPPPLAVPVASPPPPAAAARGAKPQTAESLPRVAPAARPSRGGPSPVAVVAVLAVLALVGVGALAGGYYYFFGRSEPEQVAALDPDADSGEAAAGLAAGASGELEADAAPPPTLPARPSRSQTAARDTAPADAQAAGARQPAGSGGSAGRGSAGAGSGAVTAQAPAATPRPAPAATPAPRAAPPANPPVALGCEGVPDGCAALTRALHDALESAGLPLTRPDRAEVQLRVSVEEIEARQENQFGTTFVVRTYSVSAMAESPRFGELVPMPAPDQIRFDTRFGAEKLNEGSRVIASDITDRINRYWSKRVP